MLATISKYKVALIILAVIVLAFFIYSAVRSGGKDTSAALEKTQVAGTQVITTDSPGKEFVQQLLTIQKIRLNADFFSDQVFGELRDFSKELVPQPVGRYNPFAPIGEGESVRRDADIQINTSTDVANPPAKATSTPKGTNPTSPKTKK